MSRLVASSFKHSVDTYWLTSLESPNQLWTEELAASSAEVIKFNAPPSPRLSQSRDRRLEHLCVLNFARRLRGRGLHPLLLAHRLSRLRARLLSLRCASTMVCFAFSCTASCSAASAACAACAAFGSSTAAGTDSHVSSSLSKRRSVGPCDLRRRATGTS